MGLAKPLALKPRPRQEADCHRQAAWLELVLLALALPAKLLLHEGLHVPHQVGGLEDVQLKTALMPERPGAPLNPAMSSRPPETGASLPSMPGCGPRRELVEQTGEKRLREP